MDTTTKIVFVVTTTVITITKDDSTGNDLIPYIVPSIIKKRIIEYIDYTILLWALKIITLSDTGNSRYVYGLMYKVPSLQLKLAISSFFIFFTADWKSSTLSFHADKKI